MATPLVRRMTAALSAASLLGLAACGGSGGSGSGISDDAVSGKGKTVHVWIMQGTNAKPDAYVNELTAAFKKETGAKLDLQFVEWTEAHDKFVNAIAGGTTPDVAEVGTTWTPEFADAGALVDLGPAMKKSGVDKDLVPALVTAGTVDGKTYGMPWYDGIRSVVYRKDVFAKAGVKPPTSWSELVAAGDKIKKKVPGILPFPVPGDSEYSAYSFIWGNGGDIATDQGGSWKSVIDSPQAQQGVQFWTDLARKHGFSTPAATTWDDVDLSDAFTKGDVAMMITGSWSPKALEAANPDLKGKLGAFPIPGPQPGSIAPSFLGGSHLAVFNTTKDPDLAWALVKLMGTGHFAQEWADQTGFFPGTTPLLEKAEKSSDPLVQPFAKQIVEGSATVPVTPLFGQVQGKKTVPAMLESILSGKKSVQQASTQAAKEMDDVFASGS